DPRSAGGPARGSGSVAAMATGILVVTQPGIGLALVAAAESMLGRLPLPCRAFEVPHGSDPDALLPAASAAMRRVDAGDGVLVLVDMHGSAAAQVAAKDRKSTRLNSSHV